MIILSGVLVIVAIALLVAGIVAGNAESAQVLGLDALVVIYISIAVSVVSALCLAVGVFLRRDELRGTGATAPSARKGGRKAKADKAKSGKGGKTATPVPATGRAKPPVPADPAVKDGDADGEMEIPPPPADVPEDAVVFVVRGRKRYHLDTCRQLAGRDREELTYAEAREEGFSSCTACMPDTALAARAAVSVPAGSAERAGASGAPAALATPGKGASELGKGEPGTGQQGKGGPRPATPEAAVTTELPVTGAPSSDLPGPGAPSSGTPSSGAPGASESAPSGFLSKRKASKAAPDPVPAGTPEPYKADPYKPEPYESGPAADEAKAEPVAEPEVPQSRGPLPSAWPAPGAATVTDIPVGTPADPSDSAPEAEPAASDASPSGEGAPAADDAPVRILSGTKRYHRADCSLIEDIGDEADDLETISRADAAARGCTPCLVCRPDGG
ncbi:hypothetical protein [Actinomadura sp. 9N407]|uniref:hypothetical protein n=1 Tax=Actinomadura sp. 9N407 TaxID=3375154 RepID=UPI0037BBD952